MRWPFAFLILSFATACGQDAAPVPPLGPTWAFTPARDSFSPQALLDLRSLNETVAGEHGFVRVGGDGDFVRGDGRSIRFWAVNSFVARELPFAPRPRGPQEAPDLAHHARFLAKRGVNLVRLHSHLNPPPEAPLESINEAERDWIWRTVAAMKAEGIYVAICPYWANDARIGADWEVPGGAEQSSQGLLFFDERLQQGYRAWLRALLEAPNPYADDLPLAKDPAVALIQLQNEDSLLFWTVNGLGAEQQRRLGIRFGKWLAKRHRSLRAAVLRWDGDALPADDLATGVIGFHNVWELTQDRSGGRATRLADQLEFWSDTMREFDAQTVRFLREELGCRHLVNAGNWKTASDERLNDAERWTYAAGDVQAVNHYVSGEHVGEYANWAIADGDRYTDTSVLKEPWRLPINVRQPRGMPFVVTEGLWIPPLSFVAEGPFLLAAYQSLTGVDAHFWFAVTEDDWAPPRSANGYLPSLAKWSCQPPDVFGTFPAAALVFRRGLVRRADPVVVERRPVEDLWQRVPCAVVERSGFDPNRDVVRVDGEPVGGDRISPLAFLAGPVEIVFGGKRARVETAALRGLIGEGTVRSATDEVSLDWHSGVCSVDTPAAKGVAGFLGGRGPMRLAEVTIEVDNPYAAVWVVALDGEPLTRSGRILVQVGTRCRPTGWLAVPASVEREGGALPGLRIESIGGPPWAIEKARVRVSFAKARVHRGTVLDPNGEARGPAAVASQGAAVVLDFPDDALYVVLEE